MLKTRKMLTPKELKFLKEFEFLLLINCKVVFNIYIPDEFGIIRTVLTRPNFNKSTTIQKTLLQQQFVYIN